MKAKWILYEDPLIYDGYILKFNLDGVIDWRDNYAVSQLSKEEKAKIEKTIHKMLRKMKKNS